MPVHSWGHITVWTFGIRDILVFRSIPHGAKLSSWSHAISQCMTIILKLQY